MAAQLARSVDNKTQTLTSGEVGDILSTYLAETNLSTTRHIKLELTRNCCSSGTITIYYPPRYVFTTILDSELVVVSGINDRRAYFTLGGIDISYIKKFEARNAVCDFKPLKTTALLQKSKLTSKH